MTNGTWELDWGSKVHNSCSTAPVRTKREVDEDFYYKAINEVSFFVFKLIKLYNYWLFLFQLSFENYKCLLVIYISCTIDLYIYMSVVKHKLPAEIQEIKLDDV